MRDARKLPEPYRAVPQYEMSRQAIDKHMEEISKEGRQVVGYHVLLDTEPN